MSILQPSIVGQAPVMNTQAATFMINGNDNKQNLNSQNELR